jgi:hypothetical protein
LDGFWQIQKHDFYLKKIYLFLHFGKYFWYWMNFQKKKDSMKNDFI